jgi:hypothetical protein
LKRPSRWHRVRFRFGSDGSGGSVTAKAEIDEPKHSNRWHIRVEIQAPLPASGKPRAESEHAKGGVGVVNYALLKSRRPFWSVG